MHPASPTIDANPTSKSTMPESCSMRLLERLKRAPKGSSKIQNANADNPACNFLSLSSIAFVVCAGT